MKRVLIIGGAGFIGINSASYFLRKSYKVTIFDNFSREGSRKNVLWIKEKFGTKDLIVAEGDIRYDFRRLKELVKDADLILHLAAQVAVTTSVENPREDFEINALGTFNVLEAVRKSGNNPVLIYSSTNKVYGALEDLKINEGKTRYTFKNLPFGVSEERAMDFHTIVFRQSCIYGPHQFGVEDQGWVAWFIISLILGKRITIYGNGKQVRDLLYIDDLIKAYDLAAKNIKKTKGQIYNIGGGPRNTISVWWEFKPILEKLFRRKIEAKFSDWRPGDQPIYISDIRKAKRDFGWEPKIDVGSGIRKLYKWVKENKELF